MKKEELIEFLDEKGYIRDSWGHFHKGTIRWKIQKISVRVETKCLKTGWIKIYSDYYKNLEIKENGKIGRRKK